MVLNCGRGTLNISQGNANIICYWDALCKTIVCILFLPGNTKSPPLVNAQFQGLNINV